MRAIQYKEHGGYENLKMVNLPMPSCGKNEVMVKITKAAINAGDNTLRYGGFAGSKLPMVPGFEGAGVVIESNSADWKTGTRVMFTGQFGITTDGTWQEYVVVPQSQCVAIPETLSDSEAAGFPIAYLTAFFALKSGGFKPGKSVLVSSVGGGVGNAGIQLAKALGAGKVISTSGSKAKTKLALDMGYQNVVDLSKGKFDSEVMDLTDNKGVDIILDGLAGSFSGEAAKTLSNSGKHVIYGATMGALINVNAFDLIFKNSSITGFAALIAQPVDEINAAYKVIVDLAEQNKIKPVVAKEFPLENAVEAQKYQIGSRPFGKVVLSI
jgi:NADPH:quinone reductase-like Zn-dependent oxidoreductase